MAKVQPIEGHYIHCYKMPPSRPGTSIKRGGHGGSVKCENSNLQQFFQVDCVI
jgi:hypothetical protein